MKKVKLLFITFSLLGLIGFSQQAEAAEKIITVNESKVAARATGDIQTVTLNHGESFTVRKFLVATGKDGFEGVNTSSVLQVVPMSLNSESFSVEVLKDNGTYLVNPKFIYSSLYTLEYTAAKPAENAWTRYRITNYSSGSVTYTVGLNTKFVNATSSVSSDYSGLYMLGQ